MIKLRGSRRVILWSFMVLCFVGLSAFPIKASAVNELVMTSVLDIAKIKGDVTYQTVNLNYSIHCAGYKFTVPKDAMVKIVTNVSDLCANYSDTDGNSFSHYLKVATRIYRNAAYVDQVGAEVTAFRNQNSDTGSLFLTAGEYYVQFEETDPIQTNNVLTCLFSGSVLSANYLIQYYKVCYGKSYTEKARNC